MNERHARLLCGLIEQYIKTGEPAGSSTLANSLGLAISSATIRTALQELDELGYVEQPHTSAGRIPTDKGYRFYVDNVVAAQLRAAEQVRIKQAYLQLYQEYQHRSRTAAKLLAQLAHTVAVSAGANQTDVYEAGMHELLENLDSENLVAAREMSSILAVIDHYAPRLAELAEDKSTVFIGGENPVVEARHTSLLVRQAGRPGGPTLLLVIAGPKRMSYRRNLALLDHVAQVLEQTI